MVCIFFVPATSPRRALRARPVRSRAGAAVGTRQPQYCRLSCRGLSCHLQCPRTTATIKLSCCGFFLRNQIAPATEARTKNHHPAPLPPVPSLVWTRILDLQYGTARRHSTNSFVVGSRWPALSRKAVLQKTPLRPNASQNDPQQPAMTATTAQRLLKQVDSGF